MISEYQVAIGWPPPRFTCSASPVFKPGAIGSPGVDSGLPCIGIGRVALTDLLSKTSIPNAHSELRRYSEYGRGLDVRSERTGQAAGVM
jgi:hypothetical protein